MIVRHAATRLLEALDDTPVVYLQGARQTGKSTLAKRLAEQRFASYLTLDTAAVLAAATNDPDGFVAGLARPAVIDEAQRAPALPLAIKAAVDADRRPGQFLLTGSAGALALPKLADSLAGRMELHTLWPSRKARRKVCGRRSSIGCSPKTWCRPQWRHARTTR